MTSMTGSDRRAGQRRRRALIAASRSSLLALPFVASSYVLSVATLALYLAYVGQAWNVMMGFAGQLSLGHSLYVGLGAYASAGLFFHYGIGPWAGVWLAIVLCAAVGAFIGFLAFRLRISGVQLSLLTIAFAELARIGFDHLDWLGGPGGLFLRVAEREPHRPARFPRPARDVLLRDARAGGRRARAVRFLLRRRAGYYWRAIREDEVAAQALGIDIFRWKMLAVVLSSAMTAVAGVFFAFYYNSLFPEQIFGFGRSIEIILGPVIGGVGTLFGPIVGAGGARAARRRNHRDPDRLGFDVPGAKQVVYGLLLLLVTIYLPNGLWPPLARALGFEPEEALTWRCSRSRT